MSEKQFRQAIDAVRDVAVDPTSASRVATRIQHAALLRRRPWKLASLAAAALIAVLLWPRSEQPSSEPTVLAPAPDDEEQPQEKPKEEDLIEEVEETPLVVEKQEADVIEETPIVQSTSVDRADAAAKKWNKELAQPLAELRKLGGGRIVVLMGEFDDVSSVLRRYRVPHTITVKLDAETLEKAQLVLLPCTRPPGKEVDFAPLAKFVKQGGWIAASDWGVRWLERAAPKTIVAIKSKTGQPDRVTEVVPAKTSPLLAGVFREGDPVQWWFEEASQYVGVEAETARTLVRSRTLRVFGVPGDVVVECPYGKGRVIFTQAHFDQKKPGKKPPSVAAMHRLLLNVLFERFVRR